MGFLDQVDPKWVRLAAVIAGTVIVYGLCLALLGRAFSLARNRQEGRPGAERTLSYLAELEKTLVRALLALAFLAAAVGVLGAFGFEKFVDPTLEFVQKKGFKIVLILFLVFLARRALKFLVGQFAAHLQRLGPRTRDDEVRLKTLTDVLTGGGSVVILLVGSFLILETVLESVGTVLASVGFLGIAVGFGAQSLVRDVISGFFILLENQLSVGDAVRINDQWGSVERIGLRTTTLRDSEGVAHIIPNGSITRVSNATKSWSRAVVHVGSDYSTDPDRVLAV